jgi:hypothetical protein
MDPKLISKGLITATVAVVSAYTVGALMMAGIALGGWEYTKRQRTRIIDKASGIR